MYSVSVTSTSAGWRDAIRESLLFRFIQTPRSGVLTFRGRNITGDSLQLTEEVLESHLLVYHHLRADVISEKDEILMEVFPNSETYGRKRRNMRLKFKLPVSIVSRRDKEEILLKHMIDTLRMVRGTKYTFGPEFLADAENVGPKDILYSIIQGARAGYFTREGSPDPVLEALKSLYPGRVEVISEGGSPSANGFFPEGEKERNHSDASACNESAASADLPSSSINTETENLVFRVSVPPLFPSAAVSIQVNAHFSVEPGDEKGLDGALPLTSIEQSEKGRPQFMRSQSGRKWEACFETSCLPPLSLCVVGGRSPPEFTLSSSWLSPSQLSVLCTHLDRIWTENQGMPIIMLWVDWLENNALGCLGLSNSLMLSDEECCVHEMDADLRAIPMVFASQEKVYAILKHEAEEQLKSFLASTHECEICFDVKKGEEFYQLPQCGHKFCLECLAEYCGTQVAEGSVQALDCMEKGCESVLPPDALRRVLSEEMYRRWETLSFQKALDSMQDIDWCPRCDAPAVKEADHESSHLARCAHCYFAFCTLCRDPFHQGTNCSSVEDKLRSLQAQAEAGKSKKEAQLKVQRYKQELMNTVTLRKISKPCPTCTTPIQRISGCNKVTCTVCRGYMCFSCGKAITGYDHFNSGRCPLSPPPTNPNLQLPPEAEPNVEYIDMQMRLEQNPNLRRQLRRCPVCRQENLKNGRNNHMRDYTQIK